MNTNLRSLGLEPILLSDETIAALITLAAEHAARIDLRLIPPRVEWRAGEPVRSGAAVA